MNQSNIMTLCPECLKQIGEAKSTVICPKYNGAAVCMFHCFNTCKYMEQSISLQRCTYRDQKQKEKEARVHKKIGLH